MINITGLEKIKYPPGTKMRVKHKHENIITITKITSWHGYDTVVWDETGVHINLYPHYHYKYDNIDVSGISREDVLEMEYEVIPKSDL